MSEMFCFQCVQTAKGTGCTVSDVCGKAPNIAYEQDVLTCGMVGLAMASDGRSAHVDAIMDGQCPRCGKAVHGGNKGFFCADRSCGFALRKDNRFFASKKKTLDKKIVGALLAEGRVSFSRLHSEKIDKTYSATIVMDAGKPGDNYVHFKLEFDSSKNGRAKS